MLRTRIPSLIIVLSLFSGLQAQEEYDLVYQGTSAVGSSWTFIEQNSNHIFFATFSASNGRELWKSDGTQEGTGIVKDINTSGSGVPSQPVGLVVNDLLYFAANAGVSSGQELWKSDGTEEGTVLIKDIYSGSSAGFSTEYIVEFEGGVAFNGKDANGEELWKSDGTEEGTVRIKDINEGSGHSYVRYIANADGTLYFIAAEASEYGLWKSDGTEVGTTKLADLGSGSGPEHVTYHQGNILFYNFTSSLANDEVWISDGTVEGTEVLTTTSTSGPINDPMVASGDNLFFRAGTDEFGIELFKTDGTAEGTGLVKDLDESAGDGFPENFIDFMGEIYFVADSKLWKSDGTEEGTVVVVSEVTNRTEILSDGSNLYYRVNGNLGIYNPTDGASTITTTPDFYVQELMTIFKEELYFIGDDNVEDEQELWKYNLSGKSNQTITFDPLGDVTFGDSDFNLSATSSSELTVSFESTDENVVEVSGNTVTIIGAGTCNIIASQPGNGEYNAAPNVIRSLTVNKASQSITFGSIPVKELTSEPFTLNAISSSSLDVSYTSATPSVATVTASGEVTIVGEGTTTITASQDGNANYLAADDVEQTLTVVDALGFSENSGIVIYPNPVLGKLHFELTNEKPAGSIELMDSFGRVLHAQKSNSPNIILEMENLVPGIYYLRHGETNKIFKVLKVDR